METVTKFSAEATADSIVRSVMNFGDDGARSDAIALFVVDCSRNRRIGLEKKRNLIIFETNDFWIQERLNRF